MIPQTSARTQILPLRSGGRLLSLPTLPHSAGSSPSSSSHSSVEWRKYMRAQHQPCIDSNMLEQAESLIVLDFPFNLASPAGATTLFDLCVTASGKPTLPRFLLVHVAFNLLRSGSTNEGGAIARGRPFHLATAGT